MDGPSMEFLVHAMTHCGLKRRRNEDAFYAVSFDGRPGAGALLMVADGLGGHSAGDVAARIAAECFESAAANLPPAPIREPDMRAVLQDATAAANRALAAHASARPRDHGLGATLAAALVSASGRAVIAWLGDSRAYLIRNSRPVRLTEDHSVVNRLVARGVIPPEAARRHPDRHLITRALGVGALVPPDFTAADLRPGDSLLLCTDGLHSVISEGALALAASMHEDPEALCAALIQAANDRGGPDNITVAAALCRD